MKVVIPENDIVAGCSNGVGDKIVITTTHRTYILHEPSRTEAMPAIDHQFPDDARQEENLQNAHKMAMKMVAAANEEAAKKAEVSKPKDAA